MDVFLHGCVLVMFCVSPQCISSTPLSQSGSPSQTKYTGIHTVPHWNMSESQSIKTKIKSLVIDKLNLPDWNMPESQSERQNRLVYIL